MTKLTRETVLEYLAQNPGDTNKRDIAKGLGVSGESRRELRLILKQLEDEGVISRIGKRSFSRADAPPPTGVVEFERVDEHGELIGRAVGKDWAVSRAWGAYTVKPPGTSLAPSPGWDVQVVAARRGE